MKKVLSIIGIILIVLLTNITIVNAISATAELKASSTSLKPGDTFTVTLSVNSDKTLAAVGGHENSGRDNDSFAYTFDNKKVELVEQKILGSAMDMNIDEGTRASEAICLVGSITSGDIYQWTFKVKENAESGETTISTTDLLLTDFEENELSVKAKPVTLNIVNTTSTDSTQPEQEDPQAGQAEQNQPGTENNSEQPSKTETPSKQEQATTQTTPNKQNTAVITNTTGNTAGKTPDTTTSKTVLPKTGFAVATGTVIAVLSVFSVITFRKLRKFNDIK